MKHIFLTTILILLFSLANSQIIKSIGINGGVSIANQDFQYRVTSISTDTYNRIGLYSSVAVEFLKSKHFNIVTEIAYAEKGNHREMTITTPDNPEGIGIKTFDTKFIYLEVSPLFKGQYEKDRVALFALLGPRIDYQLSRKSDFEYMELEEGYNKCIFGLTVGGGVEVRLKEFGVKVEYQYQHDFMDALESTKTDLVVRNKASIVSLGLKYYLKPKQKG